MQILNLFQFNLKYILEVFQSFASFHRPMANTKNGLTELILQTEINHGTGQFKRGKKTSLH